MSRRGISENTMQRVFGCIRPARTLPSNDKRSTAQSMAPNPYRSESSAASVHCRWRPFEPAAVRSCKTC